MFKQPQTDSTLDSMAFLVLRQSWRNLHPPTTALAQPGASDTEMTQYHGRLALIASHCLPASGYKERLVLVV
jgi:hypothetical protein